MCVRYKDFVKKKILISLQILYVLVQSLPRPYLTTSVASSRGIKIQTLHDIKRSKTTYTYVIVNYNKDIYNAVITKDKMYKHKH